MTERLNKWNWKNKAKTKDWTSETERLKLRQRGWTSGTERLKLRQRGWTSETERLTLIRVALKENLQLLFKTILHYNALS